MNDSSEVKFASHTHNIDIKEGRLVQDAEFFVTRSNRSKITFRIAVPRDMSKPVKNDDSGNVDIIRVVAYGTKFMPLRTRLRVRTKVLVQGWTQSRYVTTRDGRRQMVTETVADTIAILEEAPVEAEVEKVS